MSTLGGGGRLEVHLLFALVAIYPLCYPAVGPSVSVFIETCVAQMSASGSHVETRLQMTMLAPASVSSEIGDTVDLVERLTRHTLLSLLGDAR